MKTADKVDIQKFMGDWYVIAGRTTFLEKGAHNALEQYEWNAKKKRIDISFKFNKDSFDGKVKKIPQKGWIHNKKTNAHWKVRPIWPLLLDYLIIDLAEDYSWTAIGVPSQSYLWIMSREKKVSKQKLDEIIERLNKKNYDTKDIKIIPHQ